jgi:SnoaL-like domain
MNFEDRIAIQDLNYRYAAHIDFKQVDEWVDLFTEDGVLDEREFGFGVHDGRTAIRAYAEALVADVVHAMHHVTNQLVTDVSATEATGTVFAIVEGMTRSSGHARYSLYYEDQYLKTAAGWRFRRRLLRKVFPPEILASSHAG